MVFSALSRRGLIASIIVVLLYTGCSMPSLRPMFLTSESTSAKKIKVPLVTQNEENMCGIAVVKMIENFYQLPINNQYYDNLKSEVEINKGASGEKLKELFVKSNYSAVVFPGDMSQEVNGIYHHIDNGHPLIIMIGSENQRHFMVAVGYDPEYQNIFLNDPINGAISLSFESFIKLWKPANNFTLLAYPK